MNEEKIKKIALIALVLAMIATSQTNATSEIYNFIAGDNINISQEGNNITITGDATWTLSGLSTDNLSVQNINITGYISNPENDPSTEKAIRFDSPTALWAYFLDKYNNAFSGLFMSANHFYITVGAYPNVFTHEIDVYDGEVQINGKLVLNGVDNSNNNIRITALENNNTKHRQTAFEINLNQSVIQKSDLVVLPYNMLLKNITTQLDNNTGYFNYTVNKYASYPTGNSTIIIINSSSYINVTSMNTQLNRHESIEIVYNNYSKVNTSIILFEFEYQ